MPWRTSPAPWRPRTQHRRSPDPAEQDRYRRRMPWTFLLPPLSLPPPFSRGRYWSRGGACPCRLAAPAPTGSPTGPAAPAALPSSAAAGFHVHGYNNSSPSGN